MKILIISGAKKNGQIDKLVSRFTEGASSAGHEIETAYLFNLKDIHGCIDCQTCRKNNGSCIWQDDITPLLDKILETDVIVFASPIYFFSISSQLKLFMDRTYAIMEQLKDKKFYFIATAAGHSADYTEDFRRFVEPVIGWVNGFEGMSETIDASM